MSKSGGLECVAWTWGIALLVGVFAASALWVLGGWTFMQGAFMGVLLLLILGALLTIMMCRGEAAGVHGAAPAAPRAPAARSSGAASGGSSGAASAVPAAAVTRAAAPAPVPAPEAMAAPAPVPAPEAMAAPAPEAMPAPEPEPAPEPAPEPQPMAGAGGEVEGRRPAALDAPRAGGADDLKRIKGIGPKLEQLCHSLGFYHFDQIAAWTEEEVAWVDRNLEGFKGRVTRDTWVAQARLLAEGGDTEFSRKVDKGDVY